MRKIFLLGAATALAYIAGRGMQQQAVAAEASGPRRSGAALSGILPILLAPRWLRPFLVLRALLPGGRQAGPR